MESCALAGLQECVHLFLLLRLMNLLNGETVYTFDLEIRIEESEDISDCRLSGQLTVFPPNLPAVTRLC